METGLQTLIEVLERKMWAGYSEVVIDHAQNPRNVGSLPDPDGYAAITGPCGDTMQIWLRVRDGVVTEATFWTDGCGATAAAGSMVTELAKGQPICLAMDISERDLLEALGGLPEASVHCACLAAVTLKTAAEQYLTPEHGC